MTGPCKRAGSRFWWYRKGTPTDILTRKSELADLGINVPTQVWRSLKTEDRKAAELAYVEVSADVERRWEQWRKMLAAGPAELSHKQVTALAGIVGRAVLSTYEENPEAAPGPPQQWLGFFVDFAAVLCPPSEIYMGDPVADLKAEISRVPAARLADYLAGQQLESVAWRRAWLEALGIVLEHYWRAVGVERMRQSLEGYGLAVTPETRSRLEERAAHFVRKAYGSLGNRLDEDEPDYREPEWLAKLPEFSPPAASNKAPAVCPSGLSFQDLIDRWAQVHTRANKAPATLKRYPPAWSSLKEFVGHDRPLDITIFDLRGWREWLLTEKGLSPSTVRKVHVTAIKTIFNRAQDDGHIDVNPATDLLPPAYSQKKTRASHFTDDEAEAILKAALAVYQSPGKRAAFTLRALRWVPWICAYTGSRVSEITQLRTSDIERTRLHGAFFVLTPDAGTIKTGVFRRVPVHAHLVEQGFLEVVGKLPPGPIFYNPARTSETPWAEAGGDVAGFVRTVAGVADPRIQPNHAWRHHFKTRCRQAGIETFWQDAFTGHAHRSEGDKYGGVTDGALRRELDKLPRIEVGEI